MQEIEVMPCRWCDAQTELKSERIKGLTAYGKPYDFDEMYLQCCECEFEFVTPNMSKINLDRMNNSGSVA